MKVHAPLRVDKDSELEISILQVEVVENFGVGNIEYKNAIRIRTSIGEYVLFNLKGGPESVRFYPLTTGHVYLSKKLTPCAFTWDSPCLVMGRGAVIIRRILLQGGYTDEFLIKECGFLRKARPVLMSVYMLDDRCKFKRARVNCKKGEKRKREETFDLLLDEIPI